jgi:Tfp pilus assembly protein PilF
MSSRAPRAFATAAALTIAAVSAAQPVKPTSYLLLVQHYAQGDRAGALAELASLTVNDAIQGWGTLKSQAERSREPMLLLRAAVMLHWDRDDADRLPLAGVEQPGGCPGRHADLAARCAALLVRWPETRDFGRRFFLAASHAAQWNACLAEGLRFARDGLKLFPRDAGLLLAAASVLEQRAAMAPLTLRDGSAGMRAAERDERQGALAARERELQEARRDLADAVAAAPELLLARVRLGRVLWRLGETDLARRALEEAIERQPTPALLLLARLFLGQVHEDAGRLEQAIEEYRGALALDASAQAAAVALSHALRLAGDSEGGKRVLVDSLAYAGRRDHGDVFWDYYTSNALGFQDELDDLRRETLR